MTFRFVARVVAVVCVALFIILGFFPRAYGPTYGIGADDGVVFITRRAAPMFVAPAMILWVAAAVPRTTLRDAVAGAVALMWVGIAASGVLAWSQGIASPLILIAALFEGAVAAALWLTRKN